MLVAVTITRTVSISIDELTKEDITGLEQRSELEDVALKLLQRCNELGKELKTLKTAPVAPRREEPSTVESTLFDVDIAPEAVEHKKKKIHSTTGNNVGVKIGLTSKYHYVSYNKSMPKRPWNAAIKNKDGKYSEYFETELAAALAADAYLDLTKDKRRPKNRIDHQEIAEAFVKSQKEQR